MLHIYSSIAIDLSFEGTMQKKIYNTDIFPFDMNITV